MPASSLKKALGEGGATQSPDQSGQSADCAAPVGSLSPGRGDAVLPANSPLASQRRHRRVDDISANIRVLLDLIAGRRG